MSDEVLTYFQTLSNWGRWGADDTRGTLNLIGADAAATALHGRRGTVVSCARVLTPRMGSEVQRFMIRSGEGIADTHRLLPSEPKLRGDMHSASEYLGIKFHGSSVTHVDALAHIFWKGRAYNDTPAELISTEHGATRLAITELKDGVICRGVLVDVAAFLGVDVVEADTVIVPALLEHVLRHEGAEVRAGDALLLRTGFASATTTPDRGRRYAGWDYTCLPWLHENDVAIIAHDGTNDSHSPRVDAISMPIHAVGIVAMGLWLIDNCALDDLSSACAAAGTYEFAFVLSPLALAGCTGSPVNPLAII